jgi:hypothetical protein
MPSVHSGRHLRSGARATLALATAFACALATTLAIALLATLIPISSPGQPCSPATAMPSSGPITVGPPGAGQRVGATEYGGPGDPTSGTVGASGKSLLAHPDSYAELGGSTFQTATAMGGLPYMTPLRITWEGRSAIAYKRDFGLGGGPIAGLPRAIDLWWQFAGALGIPYHHGLWSGPVTIERPPAAGAGNVLGEEVTPPTRGGTTEATACAPLGISGVALTAGPRAKLLSDGQAAAPAGAPAEVKGIIAAGNQIVGKPYQLGGGHGLPLDQIAPTYDCSSSVEHLLYGGGLLPVNYDAASRTLESFGLPGPGRWVTIYASPDHVFMYVGELRWDTHNAAGPQDGSAGIGWHALVRGAAGFVARHPVGL